MCLSVSVCIGCGGGSRMRRQTRGSAHLLHHQFVSHPTEAGDQIAFMTHANNNSHPPASSSCLRNFFHPLLFLYISLWLRLPLSTCVYLRLPLSLTIFLSVSTHLLRSRTKKSVNDLSSRAHARTHAHTPHCGTAGTHRHTHDDSTDRHRHSLSRSFSVHVSVFLVSSL